jgi:hypothetical protein
MDQTAPSDPLKKLVHVKPDGRNLYFFTFGDEKFPEIIKEEPAKAVSTGTGDKANV